MTDVRYEKCRVELADSFWSCLDAVARERRYLMFLEGPPIESTRKFVAGIVEKGSTQYFATLEGRVIGWCDILPGTREGTRHSGHMGMGVLADYRGQGIGKRLLSLALDDAWSKGLSRIELLVFRSNTRAIALYKAMGFEEEGVMRRAWRLDDRDDDFISMAMLRNPTGP